jgi:hypothetical protein
MSYRDSIMSKTHKNRSDLISLPSGIIISVQAKERRDFEAKTREKIPT